jgi:hypothetical protein
MRSLNGPDMHFLRLALALACVAPFAALAEIGPQARELLEINKKMAEPTCQRVKLVLEMAGARNLGQAERVKALQLEVKQIDDDPRIIALTRRGRELGDGPFTREEQQALRDQMGTIQNACPWLSPAPKK